MVSSSPELHTLFKDASLIMGNAQRWAYRTNGLSLGRMAFYCISYLGTVYHFPAFYVIDFRCNVILFFFLQVGGEVEVNVLLLSVCRDILWIFGVSLSCSIFLSLFVTIFLHPIAWMLRCFNTATRCIFVWYLGTDTIFYGVLCCILPIQTSSPYMVKELPKITIEIIPSWFKEISQPSMWLFWSQCTVSGWYFLVGPSH